ncbi:hypothetical protein [Sphaerochaeta globosa]|uniref:Uncharacterized protein n=1 Tax=Sphaerochaeta globosa (strain ATCC BAA-1886 / DSM 22777 / Buddy) TaxID=158189 RepID=F0RWN5_SPHGB|nr:hypothetical protein [Sphaerochaeta globosa]ADY13666.1 hypothetical protein SpiBuddy_1842 [Sphaerochaeta globosa str. Buddy]
MSDCIEIVKHYCWMASYFINNDLSSYTKGELAQIEKFEEELKEVYGASVEVIDCSEDSEFGTPDYGGLRGTLSAYKVRYEPSDLPSEFWDDGYKQEALRSRYW